MLNTYQAASDALQGLQAAIRRGIEYVNDGRGDYSATVDVTVRKDDYTDRVLVTVRLNSTDVIVVAES